jgi:serine/threonine-protein kinase CTR1
VAVKVIRSGLQGGDTATERELTILSTLRHPRLLSLMGICRDVPPALGSAALVVEFMQQGTLYTALRSHATTPLSEAERLHIAVDVADGMRFLHHSGVVHRDLKSANILLDGKGQAKVCDFGLSTIKDAALSHVTGVTGTAAWTAPEALTGSRVRPSCDVYSFGVVLWELVTGEVPWADCTMVQVVCQVAAMNARLVIPTPTPSSHLRSEQAMAMIRSCFVSEAPSGESLRPTFDSLHTELHRLKVLAQQTRDDTSDVLSRAEGCMICPISYDIMSDPVICSDGFSYERSSIEVWLQESSVSPMTGARLANNALIPNHSLKSLITSLTS